MAFAEHADGVAALAQAKDSAETDGLRMAAVIGTGLLPHLASRFRRQAEVVAVEVLHWILVTDPVARAWFCTLLAASTVNDRPERLSSSPRFSATASGRICARSSERRGRRWSS